ncbi:MAG: S8 family serine peptidase [Actinomycetota bacterium]|nr:S8 family serine peptidase [Actinomycetota bacterium]
MGRDRLPAFQVLRRGAAVTLLTALVLIVIISHPSVADEPSVGSEYLVKADPASLTGTGLEIVRDVGFGWTLVRSTRSVAADGLTESSPRTASPEVIPNVLYDLLGESLFGDQWALENTGQTGGTPDADIDAPDAWGRTSGAASVVIAILDTGLDLDHPDLIDRIWTNGGEIPGNGIDDDANGYVDDVNGWDMVDQNASPEDELGHGTAVTGIVAASRNGVGIVGVAPEVTIMPIRVCDVSCPLAAIVEGIRYALDNDVRILNLSVGTFSSDAPLEDAIAAADLLGAVLVAPAGNDGTDNDTRPTYPASYPFDNVISVAATDHDDRPASSNYGATSVDLSAPGRAVMTSELGGGWAPKSGTSFSAAHVSGAVTLIRSLRPLAEPAEVSSLIFSTIDPVGALAGTTVTGGRLNLNGALRAAATPVAAAVADPSSGMYPFTVTLDASDSYDPGGSELSFSWVLPGGTTATSDSVRWPVPGPGTYEVVMTVTNPEGLHSSATVEIASNAAPPVAVADADPSLGWAPLKVAVSGIGSHDPDGHIVSWDWAGPGVTASGETTSMTIDTVGDHSIELTVTDDLGATGEDSVGVLVGTDFVDTRSSIFRLDIAWMSALGITKGCNPPTNDRYCPTGTVTRGQMAAFLNRALHLPPTTADYFVDDDDSIFEGDINRLAAAGITKGCNPPTNDRYCPTGTVTRGQMAAFLHRAET